MPQSTVMNNSAIIFGASGLTGRHISRQLLQQDKHQRISTITRRALDVCDLNLTPDTRIKNSRHQAIYSNYLIDLEHALFTTGDTHNKLQALLAQHNECFLCLGTTIKTAGSKQQFSRVDLDYTAAIAQLAVQAGIKHITVISAVGANERAAFFYSRIKGKMERVLNSLPLDTLIIAQPSLLLGDRNNLQQPARTGEKIGQWLFPMMAKLFIPPFSRYKPIHAHVLATALINAPSRLGKGVHKLTFNDFVRLAKQQ